VLLRSREAPADGTAPHAVTPERTLTGVRAAVVVAGVAYMVTTAVGTWETEFGFYRAAARGDVERLRSASQRLRWVGRESPSLHAQIALFDANAGDLDAAVAEIERSLALHPTAEAWSILGDLLRRQGKPDAARDAYGEAQALQGPKARAR
jgi:cytochrome c-type biogenesis protein CcmH/NrfG